MKKKKKYEQKLECPICHAAYDMAHDATHTDAEWEAHDKRVDEQREKARRLLASVIYVDAGALLPVALQREMSDPHNVRYHDAGCDCDACIIKRGSK